MATQADKISENKSKSSAVSLSKPAENGGGGVVFTDNRPSTISRKKIQEFKNNNSSIKYQKIYQAKGYNSIAHIVASKENTNPEKSDTVQKKENKTGLPDQLKSGVEKLSGYPMDDVKVHYNSDKPSQLHAHAFAQGTDIHLSTGQEKHLAHEAWHVVQQKQGRVKPTIQMKGNISINDDVSLEKEADIMGQKALQQKQSKIGENDKGFKKVNSSIVPRIQRYLIIGDRDYTRESRAPGADLNGIVDALYDQMEAALNQADQYENEVYLFIHANAGGLVKRQIAKWIEDRQGEARADGKGTPEFGRKQQGRSYGNLVDAAKAIYGWVAAKPGRHREKQLANEVLGNDVVNLQINSLFKKIRLWIAGKGNAAAIEAELDADNPADAEWDDYRRYFNRNPVGVALGMQINSRFLPVLNNPENFNLRIKIATLHDIMKYFMDDTGTAGEGMLNEGGVPTLKATVRNGYFSHELTGHDRPTGSRVPRNAINRTLVPQNLAAERAAGRLTNSEEESSPAFKYARQHQIPMWARHSFTAARMMHLSKEVGGDKGEISAVAWSIMAFWRKHYDHRQIPYHTLHEVMDFAPAFGVDYDPLHPADNLAQQNVITQLVNAIGIKTDLGAWSTHAQGLFSRRPEGVDLIRTEAKSGNTEKNKLVRIQELAANRIWPAEGRTAKAIEFYNLLNEIPINLNIYELAATPAATNLLIKNTLLDIFRRVKNFTL